jgi:hypothetical protein
MRISRRPALSGSLCVGAQRTASQLFVALFDGV